MLLTSEQHRLFGQHSNIPECCIEAFVADVEGQVRRVNVWPRSNLIKDFAQYRICNDCLVQGNPPVPLHICDEGCREILEAFLDKDHVDKMLDAVQYGVKLRQFKRIEARRYRGVLFEFDHGPKPGVRPFEHVDPNEDEDEVVGMAWDELEEKYTKEEDECQSTD